MRGKILAIAIVTTSLFFGGVMYWLQVYGYYEEVSANTEIRLINIATGMPETIEIDSFQGIDADTSPLRFRACFITPLSQAHLVETYEAYKYATPLVAPGWFDCFDAVTIGRDLESGAAIAFLGRKGIDIVADRVIAVYPDGQAYAWHQLNEIYAE